ncbi:MAG TPA: hypothetical protein VM012_14710 [Flavitalea sp.]|nr:hypothetical protein [Flavitalea sp.]
MRIVRSIAVILLFAQQALSQNVGIGKTNPQEKLDVNGNINLSGNLKINGVAGQAGQALRMNSAGIMEWGNASSFSHVLSFSGSGSWTVPAGVTTVLIDVWGGGGGATCHGGGGGGGYISSEFTVTPGNVITFTVGIGGGATSCLNGLDGGTSTATVNGITLSADGGMGSKYNSAFKTVDFAYGGSYSLSGSSTPTYIAREGRMGKPNLSSFMQSNGATIELISGGDGGDAGNTTATGGLGSMALTNITTGVNMKNSIASSGSQGGGGGAGNEAIGGQGAGGRGLVMIRY